MFKVKLNDKSPIEIIFNDEHYEINQTIHDIKISQKSPITYEIKRPGHQLVVKFLKFDDKLKKGVAEINGKLTTFEIEDQNARISNKLNANRKHLKLFNEIKAPMPGMILDIKVTKDQHVSKDDALTVLEAMKMENVILAPFAGIIEKIHIEKGEKVEKNQSLMSIRIDQ